MASRRRIVVFDRVSADGYFSAPDGNLDWAVPDEELDKAGADGISLVDTILFGRRTYEMFAGFWPRVADDAPTAPDPHGHGRRTREHRAFATMLNEMTKLVFSRTLREVTWKNTRLLPELDPEAIEAMKRQPGKDMIMFGSGSIVSQLSQHGLIDEYQIVVNPILLGDGRPLVSGVAKRLRLELLEAKAYPTGNVRLRYAPQK